MWDVARAVGPDANPMAVLRTQVSLLGALDPEAGDVSEAANRRKAARLVAQTGTLVAGTERIQQGLDPVAPRGDLSLAADFLHMLRGAMPGD